MSCGEMWNKICHVETFLHMINVETNLFLSLFMLFCRKFCFVAIFAVLPQNQFCRAFEKLCMWRKKDKYEVWAPLNSPDWRNLVNKHREDPDQRFRCLVLNGAYLFLVQFICGVDFRHALLLYIVHRLRINCRSGSPGSSILL